MSLNHIKSRGRGKFKASMHLMVIWFASHTRYFGQKLANGALISTNYNLIQSFVERVYIEDEEPVWNWIPLLEDIRPEDYLW